LTSTLADSPTYAACLTPAGTGAIATLAVRGLAAWQTVSALFHPLSSATIVPESGRYWFGRFGADIADEVVLAVRRTTPTYWLEVHCHGGREVIALLLETLTAQSIQTCTWQQLEQRTTDDPLQALAATTLAETPTLRCASIVLDQLRGAFRRALEGVSDTFQQNQPKEGQRLLMELLCHASVGRHLIHPWRVVVAGAPNVGKSSLVNALAGFQRSIVSPIPGTTRDVVTTRLAMDGWPIELADTAGLRDAAETLEEAGSERARAAAASADLCLWVLDGSDPPVWPSFSSPAMHVVINKVDLPPVWDIREAREKGAIAVSAQTNAGITELCQSLSRWLVPVQPTPGVALPFTQELCDRLEKVLERCTTGHQAEAASLLADILVSA